MAGAYGAVDGVDAPASRRPALVARRSLALALASAALVACAAVVGLGARGASPASLLIPARGQQLVAVLQPQGPIGAEFGRKTRRTLALEAYLNTAMAGAESLADVDHAALALGLRAHLIALDQEAPEEETAAAAEDPLFPFPSAEAAFSPAHQAELEAEVERLRTENRVLKETAGSAPTQIKAPLYPYQASHFGYPWGYDKNNGWHQEIESYDADKDGCKCKIDNYARNLNCNCGSAWGAITLQDDACYGCCTYGCCNRCSCSTSSAGDGMGPTTCSCPLARNWDRGNSRSCPGWWYDNAGPLDPVGIHPNGHGGIPDIQDTPGNLLV